jgi:hypothetical protein
MNRNDATPLVEQADSPRPGGPYETSFPVFVYGDYRDLWEPGAWWQWLAASGHPVYRDCWRLLDLGCPKRELLELLLGMYVLPLSNELTEACVRELREGLNQIARAARALRRSAAVRLKVIRIPPLSLEPITLREELAEVEAQVEAAGDLAELGERRVRAQLTALAHVATVARISGATVGTRGRNNWHDREIGSIAAAFLGRPVRDPAAAQEQWRRRPQNRKVVDRFVPHYERQRWAKRRSPTNVAD